MSVKTTFLIVITAFFSCFSLAFAEQTEQTLAIIKPDAVAANHIGAIIAEYEKAGFKIDALKMTQLSKAEAEKFYLVHKDRPFYSTLVAFMTSGPVVVMVVDGKDAVAANRTLIGATDPAMAEQNTIRAKYGQSKEKNAIHGSDSKENAKAEIEFFFKPDSIYKR